MKTTFIGRLKGLGLAMALVALLAAGCDETRYSRDPPPGLGTLYVENYTGDRLHVYVDGVQQESVPQAKQRHYDLEPGIRRVALDGDDIPRSWVGDVDVLEGRRTVLEVDSASYYGAFTVRFFFD
jgi:hypothetical protein